MQIKRSYAMQYYYIIVCITHSSSSPSNLSQFRKQTIQNENNRKREEDWRFEASVLSNNVEIGWMFSCCLLHFLCKRCVAITIILKRIAFVLYQMNICELWINSYANLFTYYHQYRDQRWEKENFSKKSHSSICLNVRNSRLCNLMVINCLQMDG